MAFADNLKSLAPIDRIDGLELYDTSGKLVAKVENKAGQQGSLAVYHHLLSHHGALSPEAAREGLTLYAEHTEDARRNPGKHPNIDRLLAIDAGGQGLAGKVILRD